MGQKTMTKREKQQRAEDAKAYLLRYCQPGTRVYCVLRHCSESGMKRVIQLYAVSDAIDREEGDLVKIGHWAAAVLDRRFDCDRNGVVCNGCGMNMCFELVYSLSQALFGPGEGRALTHEEL